MEKNVEQEVTTAGLSQEQLLVLTGLQVAVRPSVWRFWQEALPDGPEVANVLPARVEFDEDGSPVAFGVRRSEMLRTIAEHGDPDSNSAQIIGIEPKRIIMVTADGTNLWPPLKVEVPSESSGGDIFDFSYI